MASHTLSLQLPPELQPSQQKRTPVPVHAAFAFTQDLLAILWEHGVIQVYDLQTRLGPGRGKVMDPVLVCSRSLSSAGSVRSFRQAAFTTLGDELRLAVLATELAGDANDIVSVADVGPSQDAQVTEIGLPKHSSRLVLSRTVVWEAPDGRLYEGMPHGSGFAGGRLL